ncbi:hypothetical protein CP533_1088 [Ophiocordyceps camponoti-saundersi (nom. inval.)]|nr:hypothetical protein CP533_1088 [Ophiocordyceps camponoti-saundersi (nom. inval.)]
MTEASEEATEPLSQPEFEGRLRGFGLDEPATPLDDGPVSLDALTIEDHHHKQGIRILVRPLTKLPGVSPGGDNCQWLALRAEVACSEQPQHKVLAVTQTAKDIKFSVRIPGETSRPPLWSEIYFDPASDQVIFLNKSDIPLELANILHHSSHVINPGLAQALKPGTWRIKVRDIAVLDFRVLEKRPVNLYQLADDAPSDSASTSQSSGKRSLTLEDDPGSRRAAKRRISDGDKNEVDNGVIMFLGPSAEPLVFPLPKTKELSAANSHALLDAREGETIAVPGVCEVDSYLLTKREPIASTALSAVYKATFSKVPDSIVTVKVLKTRVNNTNSDKPLAHERNVIRQADVWLRESQSQDDLKHDSIVRYYGGDARFLSLYMEHVDAPDLAGGRWRNKSDEFTGSYDDAWRILCDISRALDYIHDRQLVHNDIKPANILYSPHRGAVLCDFGLLNSAANSPHSGGTPYYVPPEFIGTKLRGHPSDVWALGVTMLYVLRRIPLPDSRARRNHPKQLYWMINGINNPSVAHKQYGNGQPAALQMRDWLTEIYDAREKLNARDRLQRIVKEMLVPNPNQRITMAKVLQELQSEQTVVVR